MDKLKELLEANRSADRRFEIHAKTDEETDILLYDVIGGWFGIDASAFVKELKGIKSKVINLRINSPGGDVFAARTIATAIADHPSKVIAHIDGLAASAASFLMLAANEIVASEGAFVMVHNPWALTIGDAADHEAQAALLNKIAAGMAADYAKRSGKTTDEAKAWMDAETWFTANEAKDAGLVDSVKEIIPAASASASAKWDLSAYRNAPAALFGAGAAVAAMTTAPPPPTEEVQGSALETTKGEVPMKDNPTVQDQGQTAAPSPEAIRAAERTRISEIRKAGTVARMPDEKIEAAIEAGTSVEAFCKAACDFLVENQSKHETRVGTPAATITRDETDTRRELMACAVMNRVDPTKNKVDRNNPYAYLSCLEMARTALAASGISVRGLTPNEIAIKAMQQTSDFPGVLENSARKMLLAGYEVASPTYRMWAKQSTTPDFKTMSRTRLGEAPKFLKVAEGAQIQVATMSESKETYAIVTAGRGVSFTRQMLINDDLGAFNDLVRAFGMQAAIYENKTVYAILTANAAMADTVALFYATHGNLGTGVIGNTALDAGFTAMGVQKGIDGVSVLNIKPRFLIVPLAKAATAQAAMTPVGPSVKVSDQNWFAGRLEVVADAELDGTSTAEWYLAADPAIYPGVEYSHLEGASGPQILRKENEEGILGVNLYAFLDFGAKAIDWRPLYKSSGA